MPLYEFHCTTCRKKENFATEHEAAVAGWTMVTLRARAKVKHYVYCPAHEPTAIVDGLMGAKTKATK